MMSLNEKNSNLPQTLIGLQLEKLPLLKIKNNVDLAGHSQPLKKLNQPC